MPELDPGERPVLVGELGAEREAATSPSSQSRAETSGSASLDGCTEQNSVLTAAQPPSAFIARRWAWAPGTSVPKLVQCGAW